MAVGEALLDRLRLLEARLLEAKLLEESLLVGPHSGIPRLEYSVSYPWANLVALPSVCWPNVSAAC